jgi:hypothetical protein
MRCNSDGFIVNKISREITQIGAAQKKYFFLEMPAHISYNTVQKAVGLENRSNIIHHNQQTN